MVSVSAQTPLSAVLDDARTALGRRVSYLCFPGLSRGADANGSSNRRALCHDLDLPIVGRRRQRVTLSVGREGRGGRRFTVRGALVSIAGHWRLEPCTAGVLAHLTLDYDVCAALKEQAVNELRSRSPLPIRTDADATYCDRLRARLEGPAS